MRSRALPSCSLRSGAAHPPKPLGTRRYPRPVDRSRRRIASVLLMAVILVACGRSGGTADKWAVGPQTDQPLTPVFINAQTAVGEDRFLFSVITKDGLPASSPDTGVDIAFYDLGRSKDQPQSTAKGTFANAIPDDPSHGLYITSVTFPTTGDWGAE